MSDYDTIFHITLEVEALKFQKYQRSDIVFEICKYFKVPVSLINVKEQNILKFNNTISIFPISTSAVRSLPYKIIDNIKKYFESNYQIEIFINNSDYSNFLKERYSNTNILFKNPKNIESLVRNISNISFGVFIDSGPLHVAKLYNLYGIFIETSISHKVLLNNSRNISTVKNKYTSRYCSGPCGLVDLFSFKNKVGCYENNQTSFQDIKLLKSHKELQRWNKKENYLNYMLNPVGCVNKINIESVITSIINKLKGYK